MIALESQIEEQSKNQEIEGDDVLQDDNEEELVFLSRRIQKLMQRRNQIKNHFHLEEIHPNQKLT
jgi:hypothetical protein